MTSSNIGILLTNIGSPDSPTPSSVRRYLKKFLSDKRVVELPRFIWWPLLYGMILPLRSKKSAALYQKIWTEKGSPLTLYSQNMAEKLQKQLKLPVEIGMHYGNPSIQTALEKLSNQRIEKILILPLFPQYSATTTASTFDCVTTLLKNWRKIPEIRTIHHYANNEHYIEAICHTIQKHPVQLLLFSYHGIPQRYIDNGDPYLEQCYHTTRLITEKLMLSPERYSISFQSRLGYAKWLKPYTKDILQALPKRDITDLHVICPGFAVDCLETLEEIAIRGKEQFLQAGGKKFHYISALNDNTEHISILQKIILQHLQEW